MSCRSIWKQATPLGYEPLKIILQMTSYDYKPEWFSVKIEY